MWVFRRVWSHRRGSAAQSTSSDDVSVVPSTSSDDVPSSQGGLLRTFNSLANHNFRTLWFGVLFSTAALQMGVVATPWLAYHISGSGFALGLVAMCRGLPMVVLALFAGVIADRIDKRKLLIFVQFALCALAMANAVLVYLDVVQVWHLAVIGVLQGATIPFNMTTRHAYIPELVRGEQLGNALAVDSTAMNLNRVLAPSIVGILLAWRPDAAFFALAILHAGSFVTLLRLPTGGSVAAKSAGAVADILGGLRYIWSKPLLLTIIGIGFVPVVLGMPFQQFLPVFQVDILHVGAPQLGLMFTAVGIGSLIGSVAAAYMIDHPYRGLIQIIAGIAFGLSLILFAMSSVYSISLAFLVLVGLTSQGYVSINRVLLITSTDKAYYGRVASVHFMTHAFGPAVLLPVGALVDMVGAPWTIGGAGGILAAFVAVMAVLSPRLWRRQGL